MATFLGMATIHLILKIACLAYASQGEFNRTSDLGSVDFDVEKCENTSPELMSSLQRNECCSTYHSTFRKKWYTGGHYLTSYLTTLKNLGCVEYENECLNPVYDYTPFTKLVYLNFCDRKRLIKQCTGVLQGVIDEYHFQNTMPYINQNGNLSVNEDMWNNLTSSLRPRYMTLETLNVPCVQIALFDRPSGGVGRFHEISQPFVVFCDITWVGYDIETAMERDVSPWTSWSIRCKSSLIICLIVTASLSVAVITANVIVLSVYLSTPKLRNSQAIYKMSVAASDLLSGLIVIPNIIVFAYLTFLVPRKMGDIIPAESEIIRRFPGGAVKSVLATPHIEAIGFFTTLTLTVSLYTLLTASFDRFLAIFRPLRYNKNAAQKHARIACICMWIISAFISCLPFMITRLQYKVTAGFLVTSVGSAASILMAVALAIPLLLVCITNILIFCSARKHARVRQKLRSSVIKKGRPNDDIEKRLSKVLGLMVGVFTACVLPVLLTTISAAALDNIYFPIPEKLNVTVKEIYNSIGYCFGLILVSNSLWNCLIYSARGDEFRNAVKSLRLIKLAGSTVETALSSMRRLSAATVVYYRRKSSASTDGHLSSVQTTRVTMNTENVSSSQNDLENTGASKEYYQEETGGRRKENQANESLSALDSFAVNAGADRLYLSVMENIQES